MQAHSTSRRSVPPRIRTAKNRCRTAIRAMPNPTVTEEGIVKAIAELGKASQELTLELQAMKVRRARDAKRRIPRGGLKDSRGRKRSIATMPGYHAGVAPGNKGMTYGKTPPSTHEVLRMLELAPTMALSHGTCPVCGAGHMAHHSPVCVNMSGERFRALAYVLWRGGLRIACEALKLYEHDLYPTEGYVHIERGKGGKSRDVAIDDWVWPRIEPWLRLRQTLPPGPLFCVIEGPTAGTRAWADGDVRKAMHKLAAAANVRRRCAPHQLRHAMAVSQREEGVDILYTCRQLGHTNLAITTLYLDGLPQSKVIQELRRRPVPQVSMLELLSASGRGDDQPRYSATPDLMGALAR